MDDLFTSIKIDEIIAFVSKKKDSYQLLDLHSNLEEIIEPIDKIFYTLKSLSFKKINRKKQYKNIFLIKINEPKEIKVKDICIPENIISITPEKTLFNLTSKKLSLIILLKLKL